MGIMCKCDFNRNLMAPYMMLCWKTEVKATYPDDPFRNIIFNHFRDCTARHGSACLDSPFSVSLIVKCHGQYLLLVWYHLCRGSKRAELGLKGQVKNTADGSMWNPHQGQVTNCRHLFVWLLKKNINWAMQWNHGIHYMLPLTGLFKGNLNTLPAHKWNLFR